MIELEMEQFLQVLPEIVKKRWDEDKLFTLPKRTIVYLVNDCDANLEYTRAHNIPVYKFAREGGCIVSSAGDIGIAYITKRIGVPVEFDKLVHFFVSKNLNVTREDNDILIDGYKVCSYDTNRLDENYNFYVVQISINVDLDAIKNICTKHMEKIPKGLSDFGVTTEEIKQLLNLV